ncbi:hypothetical protein M2403_004312 [Rahnella sp. BIGb0603]|nr:hypothetical protein [Rahnella sp. BIGb0603]
MPRKHLKFGKSYISDQQKVGSLAGRGCGLQNVYADKRLD